MKVELHKETLDSFKKASKINQCLKLVKDSDALKSKSANKTIILNAPIPDKFPRDFHIFDLAQFISVISIVEQPVLDFSDEKFVVINSKDGKESLKYVEGDSKLVSSSFPDKDITLDRISFVVDVSSNQFEKTLTAAHKMKLGYIGFFGDGDKIHLVAFNKNNGDQNETNRYAVEIGDSEVDCNFKMYYKLEIHDISVLLGEGDLTFSIEASSKKSMVKTGSGKTFFVAMAFECEYEGTE